MMTEALQLKKTHKVLEIGTGSGYQTALLARLASMAFSVERVEQLARTARQTLEQAGVRNATVLIGDGTLGWKPYAPYDAIIVSAASPDVPAPLVDQLADGGRLVVPLGDRDYQTLTLVRREGNQFVRRNLGDVRFVPLLGQFGFNPSDPGSMNAG
jgi:protein-L-isoaspartate(D-aspartate) O-methyltransferase